MIFDFSDDFKRGSAVMATEKSVNKRSFRDISDDYSNNVNIQNQGSVGECDDNDNLVKRQSTSDNFKPWIKRIKENATLQIEQSFVDCSPGTNENRVLAYSNSENENLRRQLANLNDELQKTIGLLVHTQKERDRETIARASLDQDLVTAQKRVAIVLAEQKEHRRQWQNEKSEADAKVFQAQALVTQFQGTLRKKEKDFERLQNQVEKIAKDQSKTLPKGSIIISKPLPRNLSQTNPVIGFPVQARSGALNSMQVLKDLEVNSQKQILKSAEVGCLFVFACTRTPLALPLDLRHLYFRI